MSITSRAIKSGALPAMELGDETPTALYRLYAAEGSLLYVGISGNLKARLAQHAITKAWWPEVARKTVAWHPTRISAAEAELTAIRVERPLHNVQGASAAPEPSPSKMRTNIDGAELVEIALMGIPPRSLKLALLELAGMTTNEALGRLDLCRTSRYTVIDALRSAQAKR